MASTPYSEKKAKFTRKAHEAARELVYPYIFGVSRARIGFKPTLLGTSRENNIYDGEKGIDLVVWVHLDRLAEPLKFLVQERFREPKYQKHEDITITVWNNNSNQPSELYKIEAGLFVYGYYNDIERKFLDAISVSVPTLFTAITSGNISNTVELNPRSNQDFYCFKFSELYDIGAVTYWQSKSNGHITQTELPSFDF